MNKTFCIPEDFVNVLLQYICFYLFQPLHCCTSSIMLSLITPLIISCVQIPAIHIITQHAQHKRGKVIGCGVHIHVYIYLPARASEQGNVIGSVRIYIYVCVQKKL